MKTHVMTAVVALLAMSCSSRGQTTDLCYECRADFNFDGMEDVAISQPERRFGNAGGGFGFFLSTTNADRIDLGTIFMHPSAANLKKVKNGEGLLTIYHRGNSVEGDLRTYSITASGIAARSSARIRPGDGGDESDQLLYESLFAGTNALITTPIADMPDFAAKRTGSWFEDCPNNGPSVQVTRDVQQSEKDHKAGSLAPQP